MNYVPLHVHTCWSLLDSTLDVDEYVSHLATKGFKAAAITDHNNIKGLVPFYKKAKAKGIRPIIGCELDMWNLFGFVGRMTLLCKNKAGYKNLITIVSMARSIERFKVDGRAKTYLAELSQYSEGLICLIGDLRSEIFTNAFTNPDMAYNSDSEEECSILLKKNYKEEIDLVLSKYREVFNDVFLFFDYSKLPALKVLGNAIKTSYKDYVPCNNIHYVKKEDIPIHDLIIKDQEAQDPAVDDQRIFLANYCLCHIPEKFPDGEKTFAVLDLIEDFAIEEPPMIPQFSVKDQIILDQDEYLKICCRKGYSDKFIKGNKIPEAIKCEYTERIRRELNIFQQAKISGYFLIVRDIVNYVKGRGLPIDSRGSSSGCLISYLLDISSIDPLMPDPTLDYSKDRELPFERFYNEGRNNATNVSLPDIDVDVPPSARPEIIDYIRNKYGHENVAHIITHSRFKGKGALKEAFRIIKPAENHFEIANEITKLFVDEAKISDELVELQEEDPSYGIIRWNIDNIQSVKKFYDQYKEVFDFAIRIEKLPKNESVHAAGLIVSDRPLKNSFPMTYSPKLDQMIIDVEGVDVEFLGGVKFDILGVAALEKAYQIERMINEKLKFVEYGRI